MSGSLGQSSTFQLDIDLRVCGCKSVLSATACILCHHDMTSPESLQDISPHQDTHVPTYDLSPRNNPPPPGAVSPVEPSLSNTAQSFEMVHADTRVMSPNENNQRAPLPQEQNLQIMPANQQTPQSQAAWNMRLSGYQAFCVVCNHYAQEPSICANCGAFGHVDCLGMTPLSGYFCLLYTSPSPRDKRQSRMPSSA